MVGDFVSGLEIFAYDNMKSSYLALKIFFFYLLKLYLQSNQKEYLVVPSMAQRVKDMALSLL